MANAAVRAAGDEVERFSAPASRWFGWAAVVAALVVAAIVVSDDPGRGIRGLFAMGAIVLATWVVLIRPCAAVHEHGVLLRNMLHDTFVPASKITAVEVAQTLQVHAQGRTFHGLGVSKTSRTIRRERAGMKPHGIGMQRDDSPGELERRGQEAIGGTYQGYVEEQVRRRSADAADDGREPVVVIVWPSVAALVAAGLLAVLTFV
jgi:hypothetical protein